MGRARWMRRVLGSVLGIVAAVAVIAAFEAIGGLLYPGPTRFETLDPADLADIVAAIPLSARLIVVAGWLAGAFGGAWLALRVSDWPPADWIVAALVLAGGIADLVQLPHPLWMLVAAVTAPLAGGWAARRAHRKPYKGAPLLG